jgi:hypothetical protein
MDEDGINLIIPPPRRAVAARAVHCDILQNFPSRTRTDPAFGVILTQIPKGALAVVDRLTRNLGEPFAKVRRQRLLPLRRRQYLHFRRPL